MGSFGLLGIKVNDLTIHTVNNKIKDCIELNQRLLIPNHNLHSLYIYHKHKVIKTFYDKADFIHIDGMALVFLGKILKLPIQRSNRITYIDWLPHLLKMSEENNFKVFYLGSKPDVITKAVGILKEKYNKLEISFHHGYFNTDRNHEDNKEVLEQINNFHPQILMVGMGMPRQELWVLNNIDNIQSNVILTSGACMDYVAGAVPTPPRWMGRIGLEWLYRLASEPKRLWGRYLIEPWYVIFLIIREIVSRARNKGMVN